MTKKIFGWVAVCLASALVLAGCGGGYKYGPLDGDIFKGDVVSNGGFVAEKGDYVYFINGVDTYTSDNTFGTPVKGALMRAKKSDLSDPEIVVPRLMVAGDYTAGIFIYGDYVYYATPTTAKNKQGSVESSWLDFTRTKLDGTGTPKDPFFRLETNTTPYRFMQTGDNVCVVYYNSTDQELVSYDVNKKKETVIAEGVSSYLFPEEKDGDLIYFVQAVENEETETTESYNTVWSVRGDGSEKKMVLNGIGTQQYNLLEDKDGLSLPAEVQGLTFTLIKNAGGAVYYSTAVVNGDASLVRYYKASAFGDDTVKNVKDAAVFADSSVFASAAVLMKDGFAYVDSARGIVYSEYDATAGKSTKTYLAAQEASGATLLYAEGDYLYYTLTSGSGVQVHRVSYAGLGEETYEGKSEKVTGYVCASGWYSPELIGGRLYFASAEDRTYNYVYVVDMAKFAEEDYKPAMIGKMNEADTETEEKAQEEDAKKQSANA